MKILFIRHAIAMKFEEYGGDDLGRPLTKKGISRARKVFTGLSRIYPDLDLIISSKANRAVQTAELINNAYKKNIPVEQTELLNPGSDYHEFLRLLHRLIGDTRILAVVGHEPDFSEIITGLLVYQGNQGPDEIESLPLIIKKASVIELEKTMDDGWVLNALIPPRTLRKLQVL